MLEVRLVPPPADDPWFVPRTAHAERLRTDMLAIAAAAIDAAAPGPPVARALADRPVDGRRILVAAIGKAAPAMARAAVHALAGHEIYGLTVAPERVGGAVEPLEPFEAGHPLPDAGSFAAARALQRELARTTADDEVLLLLSGGASALVAAPGGAVTPEDYRSLTTLLLGSGADIGAINVVRKHVDALKGGHTARLAAPSRVRALVLSDVVGDDPATIGSGPVSPDPSTFADAIDVLHSHNLWAATPERVRRHLEHGALGELPETPKPGEPVFDGVDLRVVGNNELARVGAAAAARRLGYDPVMLETPLTGEARTAGDALATRARAGSRPRIALIGGGETVVHVRGGGRGGRNQELVLAAAIGLAGEPGVLIGSFGTDGIDGPTSVAGAVADGDSVQRAAERGLDAHACLEDNDAFGFFGGLHDLLLTGPTGTNVLDVQVVLIDPDD